MSLYATPLIHCFVRNEFLHNLETGHGSFTECYMIGFCAIPGRVPSFQILLNNGAQWARTPIHALTTKKNEPLPLEQLCWWDCFVYTAHLVELPLLNACQLIDRKGQKHNGRYLFTIDWYGNGLAEDPEQHKNHHIIELDSGHLAAYPNNKVVWHDKSMITPLQGNPGYKCNTHVWSVEGIGEMTNDWSYQEK